MGIPVPRRRQSGPNGRFLSPPEPGRKRRQIVSARGDEEHSRAHRDHVGRLCGLAPGSPYREQSCANTFDLSTILLPKSEPPFVALTPSMKLAAIIPLQRRIRSRQRAKFANRRCQKLKRSANCMFRIGSEMSKILPAASPASVPLVRSGRGS